MNQARINALRISIVLENNQTLLRVELKYLTPHAYFGLQALFLALSALQEPMPTQLVSVNLFLCFL